MDKTNYELLFSERVRQSIAELMEKYGLSFDPSMDIFELVEKEDPELIIFKAAEKIVAMEKDTSMKDIVALLKDKLSMHPKQAHELADDIKKNIGYWIEIKKPQTNLEDVKKVLESFEGKPSVIGKEEKRPDQIVEEAAYQKEKFRDELLEKIKAAQEATKPQAKEVEPDEPYLKNAPVIDVDKNAQHLKSSRSPIVSQNKEVEPIETPAPSEANAKENPTTEPPAQPADKYKESI